MDQLGCITWFYLPSNTQVPNGDLAQYFADADLAPRYVPLHKYMPTKLCRRVLTDFLHRFEHPELGKATYRMVEIASNKTKIYAHVLRETKQGSVQRGQVNVVKVGELTYYRPERRDGSRAVFRDQLVHLGIDSKPLLTKEERKALAGAIEAMKERYHELAGAHRADTIRTTLRLVMIRELSAVSVRENGGVYFVPAVRAGELPRLREVFTRIGQGSTFQYIPVPDDPHNRQMVREAFDTEIGKRVHALLERVRKGHQVLPAWQVTRLENDYQEVAASCGDYDLLLGGLPGEVVDSLDTIRRLLRVAWGRIENQGGTSGRKLPT